MISKAAGYIFPDTFGNIYPDNSADINSFFRLQLDGEGDLCYSVHSGSTELQTLSNEPYRMGYGNSIANKLSGSNETG